MTKVLYEDDFVKLIKSENSIVFSSTTEMDYVVDGGVITHVVVRL